MTIWIVFAQCYEDAWVQAIFSTQEKAETYVAALRQEMLEKPHKQRSLPGLQYLVEDHEVDSEEA